MKGGSGGQGSSSVSSMGQMDLLKQISEEENKEATHFSNRNRTGATLEG